MVSYDKYIDDTQNFKMNVMLVYFDIMNFRQFVETFSHTIHIHQLNEAIRDAVNET